MTDEANLRAFAQKVMAGWPKDDSIDMSDLEIIAIRHGLLELIEVDAPCCEGCRCAWSGAEFPTKCSRKTPLLTGGK